MGGSKTSQHCFGMILNSGNSNGEVARMDLKELDFDQAILEFYTKGQPNRDGYIVLSTKMVQTEET